jgi:hypothetical protein
LTLGKGLSLISAINIWQSALVKKNLVFMPAQEGFAFTVRVCVELEK